MNSINKFYKNSLIANHNRGNTAFLRPNRHKKIFSFYSIILGIILIIFSFTSVFAAPLFIPFETLTVGSQVCDGTLANAANSLGVADGATADCSGITAPNKGLEITNFSPDPTNVTAPIVQVTLNVHFYFSGWVDDEYDIDISNDGGGVWLELEQFDGGNAAPSGSVATKTYDLTALDATLFDTIAEVDLAVVRIMGKKKVGGGSGTDTVTIYLDAIELAVQGTAAGNTAPVVAITAPADASSFVDGTNINFTGTATDAEDGNIAASLTWTSSLDGAIGATGSFSTAALSVGVHTITASVTDSGALSDSDAITVTITAANTPPTVTITAPADASSFVDGTNINFTGTATDTEDGNIAASLTWTSSLDGAIGATGSFNTTALSVGVHTITASVTDSGALSDSDAITVTITANNAPVVTITAPADASSFVDGTNINFTGTATDTEDGNIAASLTWTSSLDGAIGATGSFSTTALSVGVHTITASVTDSGGASDSDAITVTITGIANDTPVVTITAPADGATYNLTDNVTFTGTATDTEDGNLSASLSWTSSLDGVIGAGGSFSTTTLTEGTHTITASATDSGSATGTDAITVTIEGPPTVTITAPADASSFGAGSNINFTGTATDVKDGNIAASLAWTSSIDGAIGAGGSFSTTALSVGVHTITASVTDSASNPGSDAITVTITAVANNTPVVTITAPGDGSSYTSGTLVSFTGTATDVEDGSLNASIQWSSNLDGVLGAGASLNISVLSVGVHTITASATDSGSATGTDSITVTIVADVSPTVTITAPADASSFIFGANINFTGTATDPEDGVLTANLIWFSSINGGIGPGGSINVSTLSPGAHTITAQVTDSASNIGTDSITVTIVVDANPGLTTTSPDFDKMYASASSITFSGMAMDAEDGNISANIDWSSNLDGAIGTGASISSSLSDGIHLVTASITDSAPNTVTKQILIYVGVNPPTPHGGYAATTDECARCHRSHSGENESLLVYTTTPSINDFCMVCHDGTGAPTTQPISTHSNADFVADRQEQTFTLECTQCHQVHGSGNLSHIRSDIVVTAGVTTGPVVFTALTGGNSFDESDATDVDDLCATCHENASNPGFPVVNLNHEGGDHTSTGWGDQRGNNCTLCHKHSRDSNNGTDDGFMPLGCTGCHNSAQDNSDGLPVGGRVAVVGEFSALSHHVVGAVTDDQCLICHDMNNHMNGSVELINQDTSAVITESGSGEFRTANISGADLTNMTVFCESCHDVNGASRLGGLAANPFSDGNAPPEATVHSNADPGFSGQEADFTVECAQCHASHGSSNLSIIETSIIVVPATTIQVGVVYTATTGANSGDEVDAVDTDDLCVTCHQNGSNPGSPMASHDGGIHGSDLRGDDCTSCHPHDKDGDLATDDGFMPAGGSSCTSCHKGTQGSSPVRRQIVDTNADGTGTGGDFLRASHHVNGSIPVDADCEVCHDQTSHMGGNVIVFNADNAGTSYTLDDGTTDGADYVNFCTSCHDADASVTAGGAPFSDAVTPPIIDAATWAASSHATINYTCNDCHDNGHGSEKIKLLSPYNYTNDSDPDDPMQEEERFCYICHSEAGVASSDIEAQFATTVNWVLDDTGQNDLLSLNDRHDVQDTVQVTSGAVIECWDCHDVHAATNSLKVIADPDTSDGRVPGSTYYPAATTGEANSSSFMTDWCLDCHDNSFPASISVANPLTDIYTAASTTSMGAGPGPPKTLEAGFGYTAGQWMNCENCHNLGSHVTPSANGAGNNLFNLLANTYELDASYDMDLLSPIPDEGGLFTYGMTDNSIKDVTVNGYNWCQSCHTGSMGDKKDNCFACHFHGTGAKW